MCSKYAMTNEQKASSTLAKSTLARVTNREDPLWHWARCIFTPLQVPEPWIQRQVSLWYLSTVRRYTARGGSLVEFGEDRIGGIGPSETNKGDGGSDLHMIRPPRR